MDEGWRVSIGVIVFVLGGLLAFWGGSTYSATNSVFYLVTLITGCIALVVGVGLFSNVLSHIREHPMRVPGICGVLAPIIGFVGMLFATQLYSDFSWFDNALSDLGVVEGLTASLFNYGLIISGVLALIFGLGLFAFPRKTVVETNTVTSKAAIQSRTRAKRAVTKVLGIVGALIFVAGALALTLTGIYPESAKPMHYYSSVAFFVLIPVSMFVISAKFLLSSRVRMGLFAFIAAACAGIVWLVQFTVRPVAGDAIAETLSALAVSAWIVVLGFKMYGETSLPNK